MTPKRTNIELKDGVKVEILLTPALYGVGQRRGINLTEHFNHADEPSAVIRAYALVTFCAAINMWEVSRMDHPDLGEFPHDFADFEAWAWEHQDELMRVADLFMQAFVGKTMAEALKERETEGSKKKTRK